MFGWIDGRLILAWLVCCAVAVWLPGYINYRIRLRARRRIFANRGAR